jgi:hypothetical protein
LASVEESAWLIVVDSGVKVHSRKAVAPTRPSFFHHHRIFSLGNSCSPSWPAGSSSSSKIEAIGILVTPDTPDTILNAAG